MQIDHRAFPSQITGSIFGGFACQSSTLGIPSLRPTLNTHVCGGLCPSNPSPVTLRRPLTGCGVAPHAHNPIRAHTPISALQPAADVQG
ncbi:hypothetical protein N7466_010159 [Penicillium verhagenii]|uniref:uncharacterized protein n=1 Tax=Penicillium verhagenii TaxID=1562060 RepID=UPI0025455657|nr:uncharacterized protein N7466_010159 [Penicillium verhagenii]KAJ5919216.1 hypothetical protein N7466_010159 [Penicillium verhagenii]